ncbi:hypothetical protein ABZ892_28385 [Streptomyces sp. NPDC046924]|uniref:hypothetical protein n=1 Tax=Streptomyces sp. NPDC046924 TaxID=3155136 RepID=UPI0033F76287
MTALHLADEREAADLAAFLSRLLHYDRAAAVRLKASGTALAVFGRPPSFEVLAIRSVRLAKPYEDGLDVTLDVTVSAGELLESVDETAGTAVVPAAVTGPPWAGVLPPRGGWQAAAPGLPAPDALRALVAAAVTEFRTRTEALTAESRTRAELDRIGREIWSRTVGRTDLPVRAVHAAQSLGFLRPPGPAGADGAPVLLVSGAWLRLRTPYGSVALRRAGLGALGLSVR